MKPLIFGYMRVPDDMSDEEVKRKQDGMTVYAEANGFALATVYFEFADGRVDAFAETVEAILRAESHHLLVPSYRDLAFSRALQDAMILTAEHARVEVVSLEERA
ncbi:hypothetical protein DF268_30300 [Streptomyces sp. V2]|uniref:Recombinase family protein n=1 Tax=Streptomyces niveiscabiei TaxID=164115 RepID=A0ABW9HL76_9ACTN|nr:MULTISPECIES: recombinase family protein [Streptomyces]PWG09827.1 hypothetical protein DF268_30300 [Streptomyces sp. V2]QZZ28214.1 recombinase family protein [Streptomyces sp. ST1015]